MNFAKFLRAPFLTEQLRWLLLWIKLKCVMKTSSVSTTASVAFTDQCLKRRLRRKLFVKKMKGWEPLTIFTKCSISDIQESPK